MEVRSAEAIFRSLGEVGARYLLVGGLAVNAYGYVRYTQDIDLVLALDSKNVAISMEALERLGFAPKMPIKVTDFADRETRESWIAEKGMLVLQLWSDSHRETPIDIFVKEPFVFDVEYARAVQFELAPDLWVPTLSLDRLLEMKTAAGRPRDLEDVRQLQKL
jgi:hypothetical protein